MFVPSTLEGPCCDQIKGSSFVWQTPQGRSSVGRNPFLPLFLRFLSFFFFHTRKDASHCQDKPPRKEAIKSSALWRSLSAVQPGKQPCILAKWKICLITVQVYQKQQAHGIKEIHTCSTVIKHMKKTFVSEFKEAERHCFDTACK